MADKTRNKTLIGFLVLLIVGAGYMYWSESSQSTTRQRSSTPTERKQRQVTDETKTKRKSRERSTVTKESSARRERQATERKKNERQGRRTVKAKKKKKKLTSPAV